MSKFSPGPWTWQQNATSGYLVDADGLPFPERVIEGLSPANARLITAAPKMYALLRRVAEIAEGEALAINQLLAHIDGN
jgi:hypothetical protein